jgi:CheY-like chemotaxis protein
MAKVMLVEDDNNLREIYEARLQAEGYTIVSAKDGEEALVLAKSEKPDLIISDIMMPKISGFEMLDILRNTDGLKDVKVIMLTALGQNDDQQRADRLGADRYLVKSQVTLEDIVKSAHELLEDQAAPTAASPTPPTPTATTIPVTAEPPDDTAQPTTHEETAPNNQIEDFVAGATQAATPPPAAPVADNQAPAPPASDSSATTDDKLVSDAAQTLVNSTEQPSSEPASEPSAPTPPPAAPPEPAATDKPEDSQANGNVPIAHKKVITPLDDQPKKDLDTLLAIETAKEASTAPTPAPVITTSDTAPPPAAETEAPADTPAIGTTIAPSAEQSNALPPASPPSGPVDPNSIAL